MDTTRHCLAPLVNRIIKNRMRISFVSLLESEALILVTEVTKCKSHPYCDNLFFLITVREPNLDSEQESFP